MKHLNESESAAIVGGEGLDGPLLPFPQQFGSGEGYIAFILALLQPRQTVHVSD